MKTRWKILIAAGVLCGLMVASLWLNSHYQPTNALEAYKKSLRERGEKLELGEVLPPPVPAASNSVTAVQDAFRLLTPGDSRTPDAMKMVAPGKALVGARQPDARSNDFTNSWADFSTYLEANRAAVEALHQVLDKPKLDFGLDYRQGATLLLPHLAPMKRSTQLLLAVATDDLHRGDPGAATTNILTMLALARNSASEGLVISHLVRLAMTAIAVAPTWELLQATNASGSQLAAVQNGWSAMDFLGDATNAFVVERAWGIHEIQKVRAMSHADLAKSMGVYGFGSSSSGSASGWEELTEKPRAAIGEFMWRSSWSYADELRTLKSETITLETLRSMQTNQDGNLKADFDAMKSRRASLGITNAGAAFFEALKIPNFSDVFSDWDLSVVVRKVIRMETARRVIITAIALKRFQIQHGKWPESLPELVPEFLPRVPIDPNDGQPLRYRANDDGTFLLYSVGEDGKDDGGDPTTTAAGSTTLFWQNDHARDWVWPQPASELEIKTYFEEEAKKSK